MDKLLFVIVASVLLLSCKQKSSGPSADLIKEMDLKRGAIISCAPGDDQFGAAQFETSCSKNVYKDFNLAITLLHSFEYDEAEKAFAIVIDKEPECAMAYWGVAMSNFHPLWAPPAQAELQKGARALQIAQSLNATKREKDYIASLAAFYEDFETISHRERCIKFENKMEQLYKKYATDKEAAIFYALALDASADPTDKSFANQRKAGDILNALYPDEPNHPGIVHYLIHTYDYPQLAKQGLAAAEKYASVAPASAHALHMPSHIFTRLGLWDKSIQSNIASVAAAKCYAESVGIKGMWDEEFHGLDYLVYAYLQKGMNDSAKSYVAYLQKVESNQPINFKAAFSLAAIPARYVLENRLWRQAAILKIFPESLDWNKFPWQKAMMHFTNLMGNANINNIPSAKNNLQALQAMHDTLASQKDNYKADQVAIQIKAGEAWINLKGGNTDDAIKLMQAAAAMEEKTEKHPVTPGELLPAMELLGDMYLQINQPEKALEAYEQNLKKNPNRFNALYGAAMAAKQAGNKQKAAVYFQQLLNMANATSQRPELSIAKSIL